MTETHLPAVAVPPPSDFPIHWADPADAGRFWRRDRMHWPDQVSPLAFSVMEEAFPSGLAAAARAYRVPLGEPVMRRINTYFYMSMPPPSSPEGETAHEAGAEAALGEAMARLGSLWNDEILPEIHRHLAAWEGYDLDAAGLPELATHLEQTVERFARLLELHFLAVFPAYLALSELDEFHRQALGGDGAFDAYRLVQGFPNKTVEVGHTLWRLSRDAAAQPEVLGTLQAPGASSPATVAALEGTASGRAFLARLRAFLEEYGQRGDKFFDLDRPAWVEEPAPVLENLRGYLAQPDDADPAAAQRGLAAEREAAVAEARRRLSSHPADARERFEFLLAAAQAGVVVTEDHGFWIDFRASYKVRRVLCALGRRLGGPAFDAPEDVFLLTLDELRETALTTPVPDRRRVVAARRAEMSRFATVRPPECVGTPPPPPPPGTPENPFARSMTKFFGDRPGAAPAAPPAPAPGEPGGPAEPGVVRGNPGSPGRATGVARVVRSLDDAHRLSPGDVLVAETTTPPWTPLFAVAGAVVTDTGGVLSHCAIVAREYGVPAVVGTGSGTDRIPDGALVEVDGDRGVVRIRG